MNKTLLLLLVLLLGSYVLGVIFSQKTISFVLKIINKLKKKREWLANLWNLQKDRIFLVLLFVVPLFSCLGFKGTLSTIELIELLVVEGTFFAVIFSLIIKNDASENRKQPVIGVKFKPKLPDYYYKTDMHIIQGGVIIASIPTYYVRLKIGNIGKKPLKNVEVVLEEVLPRPDNFMSLNLSWSGYKVPPNDVKRRVNISPGQYRALDVIEAPQSELAINLSRELKKRSDVDAPRYGAYGKGFRSCSIKPTSLSDVYKFGGYVLYLKIYADNAEPKLVYMRVDYNGKWKPNTSLKKMREKHLRVELWED